MSNIVNMATKLRAGVIMLDDENIQLKERIAELGVDQFIRFVPNVTLDQLPAYMQQARIGLSLVQVTPVSLRQNFTKLFEYMAGGLAIVANDHPNKRQYFEIADPGLLAAYEAESLATAIASLMDDSVRLRRYAVNGRRAFLENFHWEVAAELMLDFYDELLANERS